MDVTEFDKNALYQMTTVWPLGRGCAWCKFRFLFRAPEASCCQARLVPWKVRHALQKVLPQSYDGTGLLGVKCLSSFIPQSDHVLCQAVHSVHPWDTALIHSLVNI